MEVVTLPFKVAGAGLDIRASKEEGQIAEAVGEHNAAVSQAQGEESLRRRIEETKLLQRSAKKRRAANINAGAPLLLLEENAFNEKLNQLNLLREGSIEKEKFDNQAQLDLLQGKIGKKAAKRKITGTLLDLGADVGKAAFSILEPGL